MVKIDIDIVAAIYDIVSATEGFCCRCEAPLLKSLYLVWYLVILVAIGFILVVWNIVWSLED